MAGLTNFFSDSQQTQTTLPAWYDQAQQNIATQGQQAYTGAPQLSQTVAQGAINQLSGSQNPFLQAENTLNQISTGAANPWIVGPNNTVTPNINTALGGLFQAQNQQLQQLMPNITAAPTAAGTATGQFGSLRQQTAANKAMADAQSQLLSQQMQAALQNQQIGTSAATGLGTVGQQGINAAMNVGQTQQNAPFQNIGNLASLIGTLQAPTTVTSQRQLSPFSQATTIANLIGGGSGSALGKLLAGAGGLSSLLPSDLQKALGAGGLLGLLGAGASSLFGGSGSGLGSNLSAGLYPLADGGSMFIAQDGTRIITQGDGTVTAYDSSGNSLGGSINAGEGGNPAYSDENLFNQESGQTNYTQDQLDEYQNYYNQNSGGDTSASVDTGGGTDMAYTDTDDGGGLDFASSDTSMDYFG